MSQQHHAFLQFDEEQWRRLKALMGKYDLKWKEIAKIITNHIDDFEEIIQKYDRQKREAVEVV